MTITGTCYFPSYAHAVAYYGRFGGVNYKIQMGEIHIGNPPLKEGETKFLKENRWHVRSL